MNRGPWYIGPIMLVLIGIGPAGAQQPPSPRMLVPQEVRPGEVSPDPGIAVPERMIPAPRGSGAEVPLPPATSDGAAPRASPDVVVPRGGGDPGILAPAPAPPTKPDAPQR